ncbi:MAG: transposase [Lachnospiraceae bacterium]|nr:transposase [Lachnospiraceae bacterium]
MAKGKFKEWLTEEGKLKLEAWSRNGLTDEQVAKKMGVSASTLYEWKKKYPEISESLKKGKEVVDFEVENALLKRALGYKYTETTRELMKNKQSGKLELMVTKTVEKEVVPDTTAQIFWLKNRKPEVWRDKVEHVDDEDKTLTVVFANELEKFKEGEK